MTTLFPSSPATLLLCAINPVPAVVTPAPATLEVEPVWMQRCRQYGIDPRDIERDLARFRAGMSWNVKAKIA
jgi:hypothetical protein